MANLVTTTFNDGEVLTSREVNRHVTDPIEELAGRRGVVELENSLAVPDEGVVLGTTEPQPSDPALGQLWWDNTGDRPELRVWNGTEWLAPLTTRELTAAALRSRGQVSGVYDGLATQLASSFHRHNAPGTPARPQAQRELPPLQFYQSAPAPPGVALPPPSFALPGGSFVALAWGAPYLEVWRDSTFLGYGLVQGYYRDPFTLRLNAPGELVVWLLT